MMKKRKDVCMKRALKGAALMLAAALPLGMTGCGSGSSYDGYKEAYEKMAKPGSLNVDIGLTLDADGKNVAADGNMKMEKGGSMYYEMRVNDTEVTQIVKDGVMYVEINGEKSTYDIRAKNNQKPQDDGGKGNPQQKEEGSGFDLDSFLEEFASMVEAGKLKEMGLLDPIPEEVVSEIKVTQDGDGKTYDLTMPDTFVENLFNQMIDEQVSDKDFALKFSDLKDFTCVMHANGDGVLDRMEYGGTTTVTVPAGLTGEEEDAFDMKVDLKLSFIDAGSKVEFTLPDTSQY